MKMGLMIGLMVMSLNVMAGDRGNGGGVHFCETGRSEVYDVYEARTRYGLTFGNRTKPVKEYLTQAVEKLYYHNAYYAKLLKEKLRYVEQNMRIQPLIQLMKIEDANILLTDVKCTYEQLANWDNRTGFILIRKEYWDLLDNLSKAALQLHEAIYKIRRDRSDNNSDDAREMVGMLLGEQEIPKTEKIFGFEPGSKLIERTEASPVRSSLDGAQNGVVAKLHLGKEDFFDYNTDVQFTIKITYQNLEKLSRNCRSVVEMGSFYMTQHNSVRTLNVPVSGAAGVSDSGLQFCKKDLIVDMDVSLSLNGKVLEQKVFKNLNMNKRIGIEFSISQNK